MRGTPEKDDPYALRRVSGLTLDTRELELLRRALEVLASPLECEQVDQWRRAANRAVHELLGGDRVIFSLPGAGSPLMYSEEYGQDVFQEYLGTYRALDVGTRRLVEHGWDVFCKRQVYAEGLSEAEAERYARYAGEFLDPLGVHDSVGMITDPEGPYPTVLWIHHERFGSPNAGERGMAIFRLLLPAFRAGTSLWRQLYEARARLGALLDQLQPPLALWDWQGEEVHRNRALRTLLEESDDPEAIETRIREAARRTGALFRPGPAGGGGEPPRRFAAGGSGYQLHAVLLDRPLGLGRKFVLVSVRAARRPPSAPQLQKRFGLTPREAEVARLLWHRKTNREIARALVISPHTARHHTERVREKLGVSSRIEVREVLERGVPG